MKKTFPAWIVLTVIAVVAALALAITHDSTKDRIAAIEADKAVAVRQSLLPEAQQFNLVEAVDTASGATVSSNAVISAVDQAYEQLGGQAGTVTVEVKGFIDPIAVTVTVGEDGKTEKLEVAQSSSATDASFVEKVRSEEFTSQFIGKGCNLLVADLGDAIVYEGVNAKGEVVGYVTTSTVQGFGGPVEITVAANAEEVDGEVKGVLKGISVGGASFSETPGLGAKSKDAAFTEQFENKVLPVDLTKNDGEIDAITAATITSSAVVRGVNDAAGKIGAVAGFSIEGAVSINELGNNRYSTATKGFAGDVYVELQLDENGVITEIIIGDDNFAETSGYGARALEESFWGQFIGKSGTIVYGEGVDAMSGATITSNAVLTSVNNILLYHADPVAFAAAQAAAETAAEPADDEAPATETAANEYAVTGAGLTGNISIVVTMNADGTIANVAVKGTDSDMDAGFLAKCDDAFLSQFVGKTIPVEGIDTVAGATVSSKGIIDAVNTVEVAAPAAGTEYAVTGAGLTGNISIVVTVAEDGTIANVAVKGTDSDMDAGFLAKCDDAFLAQFVGKTIPVEGIDTVAGATVSSKGIIDAVNTVVVETAAEETPAEEPAAEEVTGTEYAATGAGLTGNISIVVTVAEDGTIANVAVKGTDSDMDTAFLSKCDDAFLAQFVGKTIPVEGIDTVAGATVSSKGIIDAVNTVEVAAPVAGTEYAVTGAGLTGNISIVVTVAEDGTIANVAVKGTDSDMDTAFLSKCDDAFLSQFVGKTIPVEGIDTVAGATVSSKGIIDAVNTVEVETPAEETPAEEEPAAEEVTGTEYAATGAGLTGNISIVVTMNDDGTIANVAMKGTDSDMDTAFLSKCDDAFLSQFVGKTIPVEGIDTVAGATVSSKGIIDAVNTVVVEAPAAEETPAEEEPAAEEVTGTEYAVTGAGLTGNISIVVTVAEDGTIANVAVKGTDSDMDAAFLSKCDDAFLAQFVGKTIPVEGIDTVAGATVSSKGIIDAVNTVVVEASAAEETPAEEEPAAEGKTGHAVASSKGFAGPVAVDVTVENGVITALVIGDEQFKETEGFGAKALEETFVNQFIGKTLPIEKADIDVIAGATFTTDAVIAALNKAYEKVGVEDESTEAPAVDATTASTSAAEALDVTSAKVSGDTLGKFYARHTAQGFAGPVTVLINVDNTGKICMIEVGSDEFAETKGLGAKALEEDFLSQFIGKTCPVKAEDIDAISGATITTNAVIEAINKAYDLVK